MKPEGSRNDAARSTLMHERVTGHGGVGARVPKGRTRQLWTF